MNTMPVTQLYAKSINFMQHLHWIDNSHDKSTAGQIVVEFNKIET
jgi:hypothetical protein